MSRTSTAPTAAVFRELPADKTGIRPLRVNVPEEELAELRRRINATRWPDRETVTDQTQGVQLATTQALARYWATDYDWRKVEAKLNALPNFITEIDGLDIHFIHVRSKHENALPLIVTHGWPGSIIEQLKIIGPLTDPTAHGGKVEDAFDVVIPSMPGYGFSGKPTSPGWDPAHIARAWVVLMKRLGYTKFVAQGGDWGAIIVDMMGLQAAPELLGIHTNMPGIFPADIDGAAFSGAPRLRVSQPMRNSLTTGCSSFIRRESLTGSRWVCDRKHYTESRTHPSAWRLISLTTTSQLRLDLARLRRRIRRPHARRHPRQHHDHLVDQHGTFRRPPLLGILGERVLQCEGRLHPGCRERLP